MKYGQNVSFIFNVVSQVERASKCGGGGCGASATPEPPLATGLLCTMKPLLPCIYRPRLNRELSYIGK